jgi:hypothetical protein
MALRSRSLSVQSLLPIGSLTLSFLFGCGGDPGDLAGDLPGDELASRRAQVITRTDDIDCPPGVPCDEWPAAFAVTDSKTGSYGNYDLAARESDGLDVQYIVIHTTEGSYDGTIAVFQDPTYLASSHYLIRSRDGNLAKLISPDHVAWHAGNWYYNMHAIGIEHEAIAAQGHAYLTDALYKTSAALVRYLCQRYAIPMDREHIIGHDEVPGLSVAKTPGMHWDPGPYWDWDRFMRMLRPSGAESPGDRPDDGTSGPVRIQPDYAENRPVTSYCFTSTDCREVPGTPSNFVYLHQAPSATSPLIVNNYLAGTPGDRMNNWANKAGTGRLYYRIDRSGDWDAIWFGGQVGWFYNPGRQSTRIPLLSGSQTIVTPKAGSGKIAVYGGGYPGAGAYTPPKTPATLEKVYDLPEGQRYVAFGPVTADYYWAKVWAKTLPMSTNQEIKDGTQYYVLSYNHRLALVRADAVTVLRTSSSHGGGIDRRESAIGWRSEDDTADAHEVTPEMSLRDLKGMN